MSRPHNIVELLAAANGLEPNASPDERVAVMADLRAALADGLVAMGATELRAFVSVAHRFDFPADVWNATRLLERLEPLDPHARVARARAWLQLFPDSARSRPELVSTLLAGDPPPTDASLSTLLTTWIGRRVHFDDGDLLETKAAVFDLAAANRLASNWWPRSEWQTRARAFTHAYVNAARALGETIERLDEASRRQMAPVWAQALLLTGSPQADGSDDGDTDEPAGSTTTSRVERDRQPTDDDLYRMAASLGTERRRIWVVGGLAAHWSSLAGVAKTLGVESSVLVHVPYDDVKQRSVLRRVHPRDAGVLLGPVPHSASEVGGFASPASQLRREAGIPVIELRAQSTSHELKVTKRSFREGLIALLTELVATELPPPSVVQPLWQVNT